jgi:hypothetical protein
MNKSKFEWVIGFYDPISRRTLTDRMFVKLSNRPCDESYLWEGCGNYSENLKNLPKVAWCGSISGVDNDILMSLPEDVSAVCYLYDGLGVLMERIELKKVNFKENSDEKISITAGEVNQEYIWKH